ncbi:unnamed protein product, partial [Prunus brigantina]
GNGIAPIKLFRESEAIGSLARHGLGLALACAFRESEAIGSLAWRGLPCVGMSWPRPWHALACHALALPCVGIHALLRLCLALPWRAVPMA